MNTRLGRYRLERRVAMGGMAEVFLATVQGAAGFEKQVAVKRILPHLAADPDFVQMFLDEARVASRLSHANIAQVFDFAEEDGCHFIAMEWVHGRDLRRVRLAAQDAGLTITPLRAAHVAREVARALQHAHALADADGRPLGLVHRDVSPQNILLSFSGEVKLTDFGIAKAARRRSSTAAGLVKGKCAYMSPEQARGEPVDARTDVFALGVVLWETLTRRALFTGGSDLEVLRAVQVQAAPPPSSLVPEVPRDLDAVVLRALEKDAARRFSSAAALEAALGELIFRRVRDPRELELVGLLRALFPDEAAGVRKVTARLPAAPASPGPASAGVGASSAPVRHGPAEAATAALVGPAEPASLGSRVEPGYDDEPAESAPGEDRPAGAGREPDPSPLRHTETAEAPALHGARRRLGPWLGAGLALALVGAAWVAGRPPPTEPREPADPPDAAGPAASAGPPPAAETATPPKPPLTDAPTSDGEAASEPSLTVAPTSDGEAASEPSLTVAPTSDGEAASESPLTGAPTPGGEPSSDLSLSGAPAPGGEASSDPSPEARPTHRKPGGHRRDRRAHRAGTSARRQPAGTTKPDGTTTPAGTRPTRALSAPSEPLPAPAAVEPAAQPEPGPVPEAQRPRREAGPIPGWGTGGTRMIGRVDRPAPPPPSAPSPPPAIPAGTRLQARLSSPVDTAGPQPVEVRVTRSLVREGRVLVPRGTRFFGAAKAQDGRVLVQFDRHVRPGTAARPAEAFALGADGRPGIPSADRLTGADEAAGLTLPPGTSLVVVLGAPLPAP